MLLLWWVVAGYLQPGLAHNKFALSGMTLMKVLMLTVINISLGPIQFTIQKISFIQTAG